MKISYFYFRAKLRFGDGGPITRYRNLMRSVHGLCCMNMGKMKCTDSNLDGDDAFLFSLIFSFFVESFLSCDGLAVYSPFSCSFCLN